MTNTLNEPLRLKVTNLRNEPQIIQRGQDLVKMLLQPIVSLDEEFPFIRTSNTAILPVRDESYAGWLLKRLLSIVFIII